MTQQLALVPTETTEEKPTLSQAELNAMKEEMTRQFYRSNIDYITDKVDFNSITKTTNYALQADGIYAIVKNRIGVFVYRSAKAELPGLPKQFDADARIYMSVPLIPGEIYFQIKQFFIDIMADMNDSEAFAQVYYDLTEKRYVVVVPEQTVAKASVTYDATKNLSVVEPERYILVFEIHSHNTMNAFWSGTDDSDEKETRFYGVFGYLDKPEHAEEFRTNVLGKYVTLKKEHIFDFSSNKISKAAAMALLGEGDDVDPAKLIEALRTRPKSVYPEEWRANVKKYSYTPAYTGGHYNRSNHYSGNGYGGNEDGWDPSQWGNAHSRTPRHSWNKGTGTAGGNWSGGNPTNHMSKKDKKNSNNFASKTSGGHGYKADDYEDDYDRYWGQKMNEFEDRYMGPGAGDAAEEAAMDSLISKEIEERFNNDTVESGYEEMACDEFARTLCPTHVADLLDALVKYGFEEEIFEYFGLEIQEPEDQPNKKAAKKKNKKG